MSTFAPKGPGADQALQQLAEALREIDPAEPALVSLRRFDASPARRRLGLPTARALRSQFKTSWPRLCAAAVTGGDQARALAALTRREEKPPSQEEVSFALRAVAARLGKDTVGQTEYERERQLMLSEQDRSWRHGIGCPLPTANQILGQGKWDDMLQAAGLKTAAKGTVSRGEPVEKLARQFIDAFGAAPTLKQVLQWARVSGIAVARPKNPNFSVRMEAIRAELEAEGRQMPGQDGSLDGAKLAERVPAQGSAKAKKSRWTRREVLTGLRTAIEELPAGQTLTQDRLIEAAVGRSDIPNLVAVQRVMQEDGLSFEEIKRTAAEGRTDS